MARSLATAFRVASTGGGSNASRSVRAGCVSGRIASARITTFGERAVDVFYVKDMFGLKIHNQARLDAIRKQLLTVLDPSSGEDVEESETPRMAEAAE